MIFFQIILAILFLFVSTIVFTLPAYYILGRRKSPLNDNLDKFVVFTVFGLVFFTLSAYLLAAVHLRFLMYAFPLFGFYIAVKSGKNLSQAKFKISNKLFFPVVLVIGIIGQVAVNAFSGFPYQEGIYFYSSHGHDGIWHLALMEEMKKNIVPFQNPELSGAKLQNYHFFVDLLMSEFSRLFAFSNLDIYFRFMPIVFSTFLGLTSFIFVREWSKSETAGIWAMFFTYFAGSFGYLLYILTHKSLGGESIFWVSQTQSVLGNPPHAAAFIILTVFLFCFLKFIKERNKFFFFLCAILGGAVIEFKVYAGVLILGGLLFTGIFDVLIRKSINIILLFIATFLISLGIYLPNSVNSQDFLIWQPWWYIRTMVVATDRLNWIDLELRRQTYIAENNWKRVIQLEMTAFLLFLFGNLGMRFLGFWTIFNQLKNNIFKNSFNLFFLNLTFASFFIPVFFLQKGVAWNSIQFNQYFLLLFGFLAAISVWEILKIFKSKLIKVLFGVAVILLAVPTQVGLLWQFYSNKPLSRISYEEIEALSYLKKQQDGRVLVAPFNKYERDKYKDPPIPIYAWYDTGYVAAFSGKQTLISDEEQINIMGYDASEVLTDRMEAFQSTDYNLINEFFEKYNVGYIYLAWDQKFATGSASIKADMVFENKDARVLKVKK